MNNSLDYFVPEHVVDILVGPKYINKSFKYLDSHTREYCDCYKLFHNFGDIPFNEVDIIKKPTKEVVIVHLITNFNLYTVTLGEDAMMNSMALHFYNNYVMMTFAKAKEQDRRVCTDCKFETFDFENTCCVII